MRRRFFVGEYREVGISDRDLHDGLAEGIFCTSHRRQISELKTRDRELASDSRQRLRFGPEFKRVISVDAKSFSSLRGCE